MLKYFEDKSKTATEIDLEKEYDDPSGPLANLRYSFVNAYEALLKYRKSKSNDISGLSIMALNHYINNIIR